MATFSTSNVTTMTSNSASELSTAYTSVPVKQFPRRPMAETSEEKYWRNFRKHTVIPSQFKGRASCIDFCPQQPHVAAITTQAKVILVNPHTHQKVKELHPNDTVYCTRWRSDGKLLVTSGEKTGLRLWNLGSMKMVRELHGDPTGMKGHKRAVHSVGFLTDRQKIVSASDDATVLVWDVSTSEVTHRITGHDDYVRTTAVHPLNPHILASGSHDRTVKVWDLRTPCTTATSVFKASDPISALVYHPSGAYVAAASATEVSIWDTTTQADEGNPAVATLAGHTKDITSIAFNFYGSRLLTGSIDRHVKLYETEGYTSVHTLSFPEPVSAVGISQDGGCLAVGGLGGKVYLRSRVGTVEEDDKIAEAFGEEGDAIQPIEELQLYSGMGDMTVQRKRNWHKPSRSAPGSDKDFTVESSHGQRLRRYDVAFKKFNYHKALDEVLAEKKNNKNRHDLFLTVIAELHRRNGLRIALTGRDSSTIVVLLQYIKFGITDPRRTDLLSLLLNLVIEIYHTVLHESPEVLKEIKAIRNKLDGRMNDLADYEVVLGTVQALSSQSKISHLKRQRRIAQGGAESSEAGESMSDDSSE